MNRNVRTVLVYLAVGFLILVAVNAFLDSSTPPAELTLNEFFAEVDEGNVAEVAILEKSEQVTGMLNDSSGLPDGATEFTVSYPN